MDCRRLPSHRKTRGCKQEKQDCTPDSLGCMLETLANTLEMLVNRLGLWGCTQVM